MSPRAVRVAETSTVERFPFGSTAPAAGTAAIVPAVATRSAQVFPAGAASASQVRLGGPPVRSAGAAATAASPDRTTTESRDAQAAERDAFAQGYAQGERAGLDVASRQLKAVHDRHGQTIEQLLGLREELTYRTERQVVELALAIASRILHREVSLDRELLLVMARIALDRMGDATSATIRLHPDDEAAARGGRDAWPGGSVAVVADANVRPGACVVQTDQGHAEVGLESQLKELAAAILGDLPVTPPAGTR